jgi:acetyl-CoA carboxylase biotin carboxylase subunit
MVEGAASTMFKKILIANRGEIAVRVAQTCREMGIRSVAVYSDADKGALHVMVADEAVAIGPALSRKSYLNIERIMHAVQKSGAQALHPGYGFLSENADFARACADAGLTFIGPPADCIARAGNKAEIRKLVAKAGFPIVPGSTAPLTNTKAACDLADEIGYPVILKASAGGGGRGMRIAHDREALADVFSIAAGEARVAFGDPSLYLEKYITRPRHIEVQVLADQQGRIIHLGERECSIQKRYQKLIEEAPSPFVDDEFRQRMGDAAVGIAEAIGYQNAGTIEFLVDAEKNFYFMEVNARIQVEHPVTEWLTGLDLVREQIRIAAGEPLAPNLDPVTIRGWAIECRINAADPDNDFMPSPGEVGHLRLPQGPGVRVDGMLYPGCLVPPFYDALVCKLSVWDHSRSAAIDRMRRALRELKVEGVTVIVPFHLRVLADPDFVRGDYDTHFLERYE